MKALPEDAQHKTELGLVALGVPDPPAVAARAAALRETMSRPEAGILVQEMVDGGVETVLSCLRQTDFGPVLTIGLGGIGIELFRDVTHLALPVDEAQVTRALRDLKLWSLLEGWRGRPAADVGALAHAAARFGDRFLALPDVMEFELNPLLVMPRGEGVVALDALVALESAADDS